ncbi:MAG: DUF448 domain-containing protein [Candidatus Cloacimonadota bacterium]|nr:DUF448 domain-containing protein [Candidatus Cloacimonadota bacterium]
MVNKASNAGHIPKRTCVICKRKREKSNLARFVIKNDSIVFYYKQKMHGRGYYCCSDVNCMNKLEKWMKKRKKK